MEAKEAKLSFEAALGKLETIVESMESGEVPLAELLAKFEDGSKLLKVCEARLKDAELKIEQLKKSFMVADTADGAIGTSWLSYLETQRDLYRNAPKNIQEGLRLRFLEFLIVKKPLTPRTSQDLYVGDNAE